MNSINQVVLEGNLARDVEVKYTPSGTALGRFTIASNRKYKKDNQEIEEVSFFNIDVWGKLAELCGQYIHKGSNVIVTGRLKQNKWQDSDGNNRFAITVIADGVKFPPKPANQQPTSQNQSFQNPPQQGNGNSNFEDDIPF